MGTGLQMITTRSLGPTENDIAQRILAAAFFDDPGAIFVSPRADKRQKHLVALYRVVVCYVQAYGKAHVAVHQSTKQAVGVTLWLESERAYPSLWQEIQHGLLGTLLACNPDVLLNAIRFNGGLHSARVRVMGNTPHTYLWMMGVLPEHQDKGIGSQLMHYAFQEAFQRGFL